MSRLPHPLSALCLGITAALCTLISSCDSPSDPEPRRYCYRVLSNATGRPLEGARVWVDFTNCGLAPFCDPVVLTKYTNSKGEACFTPSRVSAGEIRMRISKPGYITVEFSGSLPSTVRLQDAAYVRAHIFDANRHGHDALDIWWNSADVGPMGSDYISFYGAGLDTTVHLTARPPLARMQIRSWNQESGSQYMWYETPRVSHGDTTSIDISF